MGGLRDGVTVSERSVSALRTAELVDVDPVPVWFITSKPLHQDNCR